MLNIKFFSPKFLTENQFTQINILFTLLALISLLFSFKDRGNWLKISLWALSLSLFFYKYPYRFFSGQGMFFISLLSSIFIVKIISKKKIPLVFPIIIVYAVFFNITLSPASKQQKALNSSTLYNLINGKFANMLEFNCLYYPKQYLPITKIIKAYSSEDEIITSNLSIAGVIFGALANRPITTSLFLETSPNTSYNPYIPAKIIVWIKSIKPNLKEEKAKFYYSKKLNWRKIQETPISDIYLNPGETPKIKKQKPFLSLAFLQGLVLVYFLAVLLLYLKLKKPLHSSNSKL